MTDTREDQLPDMIAAVMRWGTAAGSLLTAAGLPLAASRSSWAGPVTIGGAGVFVALPILCLLVMSGAYIRENDKLFTAITVGVLALIGASVTIGVVILLDCNHEPHWPRTSPRPLDQHLGRGVTGLTSPSLRWVKPLLAHSLT